MVVKGGVESREETTREPKREPHQVIAVFQGRIFRRRVEPGRANSPFQTRRVRITAARGLYSGSVRFWPTHKLPHIPSDHSHFPIDRAEGFDGADVLRSLSTAERDSGGASTTSRDVEAGYITRGAIAKRFNRGQMGGWHSDAERRKVDRLHRRQLGSAVGHQTDENLNPQDDLF